MNRLLLLGALPLLLTACESEWMLRQTKSRYLRQFTDLVEKVEAESPGYTSDEDWVDVEERFLELSEEKYERYRPVLTREERRQVNQLRGRYTALQAKYLGRRGVEHLENAVDAGKEFLKELKK